MTTEELKFFMDCYDCAGSGECWHCDGTTGCGDAVLVPFPDKRMVCDNCLTSDDWHISEQAIEDEHNFHSSGLIPNRPRAEPDDPV